MAHIDTREVEAYIAIYWIANTTGSGHLQQWWKWVKFIHDGMVQTPLVTNLIPNLTKSMVWPKKKKADICIYNY